VARTKPFDATPLEATYYGPACKQILSSTSNYGVEFGCHVLNIWRPKGTTADAKLPVMMFVPGGSNDYGEAEPYNASAMAAHQNAIITSINYRVGAAARGFERSLRACVLARLSAVRRLS
jgi:carboxylesterase type B